MSREQFPVTAFRNEEFGSVRMINDEGRLLFSGTDVAKALGYQNPRSALATHCKGVVKRNALTAGGLQQMSFIPEGDVYRLIIRSRLESAEQFENWVFNEVLPAIRKTGGYMTESLLERAKQDPSLLIYFAEQLVAERNHGETLSNKLYEMKPKADYYDMFVNPGDCTNIRATAKELEIPEKQFCRYLMEGGFLYRGKSGKLLPYAVKKNEGMFIVRDFYMNGHLCYQTLITPKGKAFFSALFYGGDFDDFE